MPFIDSKVTVALTDEQKDSLTKKIGAALTIINKPEGFTLVGHKDNYTLYFGGEKLAKGAMISVQVFGEPKPEQTNEFTAEICRIYGEELGIPADKIYINYSGFTQWGWNGENF